MFGKKTCKFCGEKIGKKDNFCLHCGSNLSNDSNNFKGLGKVEENFGMFGKEDFKSLDDMNIRLPLGFNMIFKSLVKELDKQFKELNKEREKERKSGNYDKRDQTSRGISINITSEFNSESGQPKIKIQSFGDIPVNIKRVSKDLKEFENKNQRKIDISQNLSQEQVTKLASLPKEEPETNVRRLSNKVIYEISLPDVKTLENIAIKKLENSIEIKAIAEKSGKAYKAYSKHIPLSYPLKKYSFKGQKLVLELDAK